MLMHTMSTGGQRNQRNCRAPIHRPKPCLWLALHTKGVAFNCVLGDPESEVGCVTISHEHLVLLIGTPYRACDSDAAGMELGESRQSGSVGSVGMDDRCFQIPCLAGG